MRILVTGAGGFVGSALVQRLRASARPDDSIIATDLAFAPSSVLAGVDYRAGAIDDPSHRASILAEPVDQLFHLATIAGVQQSDFELGKRVNLEATMALLDLLSQQERPARLVYSSSVGVFGKPFPPIIDDSTLPEPPWSYGVHKLVCEHLITDYARHGRVDGIALRFPGIVARPEGSTTMLSAFVSNIFYAAREGREFSLPLGEEDGTWLMSLRRCLDNLQQAGNLDAAQLPARRAWTLPALFITMRELVDALATVYGASVREQIRFEPTEAARSLFGMVPLRATGAERLGMQGDGTALQLVKNVIAENPSLAPKAADQPQEAGHIQPS